MGTIVAFSYGWNLGISDRVHGGGHGVMREGCCGIDSHQHYHPPACVHPRISHALIHLVQQAHQLTTWYAKTVATLLVATVLV